MDVTEKHNSEKQIAFLAHHDALTALANRVQLRQHIERTLESIKRGGKASVLCLDLDNFKLINDTLGHSVGDALLCAVSERLRDLVGDGNLVSRTGGDEFAIVQSGAERPMEAAAGLATRIVEALSVPLELGDHHVVIGGSVGIAIAPDDGDNADQLLKNADMALYRAKEDGRARFHFFEPDMDVKAQARRLLELDLRKAVAADGFELFYQPIVNLADNKITGFEALLRWNHPTRGRISPAEFIPLAEETGLIATIGEWVIRQACAEAKRWPSDLRVAVNVSPVQFRHKTLLSAVVTALATSGLPANRLELEITETVLMTNNDATLEALHQLRGLGVRISMDDFGTGYSSLSYLRSFPFDKIKIDQSFVRDLIDRPDSIAIIRAVAGLGQSFGMTTTAEGVETQEQLDKMRAEGCDEVQGYFFSRPVPASEIAQLLTGFQQAANAAA
jgi:diguanylate cyclase (GGDEF)-like protein